MTIKQLRKRLDRLARPREDAGGPDLTLAAEWDNSTGARLVELRCKAEPLTHEEGLERATLRRVRMPGAVCTGLKTSRSIALLARSMAGPMLTTRDIGNCFSSLSRRRSAASLRRLRRGGPRAKSYARKLVAA